MATGTKSDGISRPGVPTHHWPATGEFEVEVVGESNYQRALSKHASHSDYGTTACLAVLWPQPNNPHDKQAVAVLVDDDVVGYLNRDDARSFRYRLKRLGMTGATTSCDARIMGGGTRRDGERLYFGVQLDMQPLEDEDDDGRGDGDRPTSTAAAPARSLASLPTAVIRAFLAFFGWTVVAILVLQILAAWLLPSASGAGWLPFIAMAFGTYRARLTFRRERD